MMRTIESLARGGAVRAAAVPVSASQRSHRGSKPRKRKQGSRVAYLYILPSFAVFATFLGWPFIQTIQYSFYTWDGLSAATWAGLSNYIDVLTDPLLREAFLHAIVLMFFFSAIPIIVALLLTAVISRANRLRGMSFYRTILFLPQVIASVVVATIWVSIYSQGGFLNQLLNLFGLGGLAQVWLGSFATALPAVGFVGTWLNFGLCLVLFLSGVGNIEPSLFEAARLDGASVGREFFSVTLPSIRGQIAAALTLTIVSSLKTFDLIYVTTRGGPGDSTAVPAYTAYNLAFNIGRVGLAAAVVVVLTAIILIITVLISRLQPKGSE